MHQDMILIIDAGSDKNAQLAREIRALGVYTEIYPYSLKKEELDKLAGIKGVIVNGGKNGEGVKVSDAIKNCGYPTVSFDYEGSAKLPEDEKARRDVLCGLIFDKWKAEKNWNAENFIADQVELLKRQIGDKKVLLALSGGVDSSVVAALLIRAVGKQLTCVHVNHGLLRKGEPEQVIKVFREELGANLVYVDATDRFLDKLAGVSDPEQKRKIIGAEFIRVFEEEARKLDGIEFLGQGTIYPDILESGSGTQKAVKAHHNVGGLPDDLKFELVEPVKMLFKDEVRAVGKALGLPDNMVYRQPFPGPGLGVRCPGAITRDRLEAVRESDAILREEFEKAGLAGKVWQYFTVVPDFKSTGIKDGKRAFEWLCIVRAINTTDVVQVTVEPIDYDLMCRITDRITHEVPGINRVLYDYTPKPTATVEYE